LYTLTVDLATSAEAFVSVRIYDKLPTIEFEVRLGEIPKTSEHGSEVTVNFISHFIDN
jgi:hypothetical protein